MKKNVVFTFLMILFFGQFSFGQIEEVRLSLEYDFDNQKHGVYLHIDKGSASTIKERVQFNSQITLIVPTGVEIDVADSHNPIVGNQFYEGSRPTEWLITAELFSPEASPEYDFISFAPALIPASFFGDLMAGDKLLLFNVTTSIPLTNEIRLYQEGLDPDENAIGMGGADLRNGYTLGSYNQLYAGNITNDPMIKNIDANTALTSSTLLQRILSID